MLLPKFVYTSPAVTLTPTYPPVNKHGASKRSAQRHDDYTGDGIGQWITDRVDKFLILQFDYVPAADMTGWKSFIDWAIEGNIFDYYPDATSGTHTTYTLEDTEWDPERNFRSADGGFFKFTLTLREYVS